MEPESVSFRALLRRHRLAAGLSQEALAERAGLSRRGIADLERGARHSPYGDTVRRLADGLALQASDRAELLAAARREPTGAASSEIHVPFEPSSLVGRQRELSEVQLLLKSVRLLTLSGAAGIGKTRLALEVARRNEHGAVFVDLAPVSDPELAPRALASALRVRDDASRPIIEAVQENVAAKRMLLVLDNCEHLLEGAARLADSLLRTCSGVRIMATSREALHIRGETVWPVPALRADEAQQLFVERARAAQASLAISDNDAAVIAAICRRLDGIPLAIELAAARVPALGIAQVETRLEERLRLLSGGSRLDSPRHRTLRAAIDWSYALLSDQERLLLERLAVFAGGWDLMALEAVCAGNGLTESGVVDVFTGLVDKSLVVAEPSAGKMRYRLLETIREYAAERLNISQQAVDAQRRHAAYFRSLAESNSITRRGVRYVSDVEGLRDELDNMRAALSALLALGEFEEGLALCTALVGFWLSQGYLSEGDEWFRRFLAHASRVGWQTQVETYFAAGRLAEYRAAYDEARARLVRSLGIAREHGSSGLAARALFGLADVAEHRGDYAAAEQHLREGLPLGREARLPDVAEALTVLARIEDLRGNSVKSRVHREEALSIRRRIGDRWGIAFVLSELGLQARRDGKLEESQTLLEDCLENWRASGSRMGERAALMNLAVTVLERGALERAAELTGQALALSQELADLSASTARCVEIAALVLHALGSTEQAVALIAAAGAHRAAAGAPIPPDEQPSIDALLQDASARLSEEQVQRACESGAHTSLQSVVLAADGLTSSAYKVRTARG